MDAIRQPFSLSAPRLKDTVQQYSWLWPVVTSLILMILTSIPYLFGALTAPTEKVFSGILYNVHDTAQYLSWMREAQTSLLIENRLTSEANPAIFFNLHWWLPGRLAGLLGLSSIQIYHLYRLVAIPFCVGVIYWLCGLFLSNQRQRVFAFLLTLFMSGFGWIWVVHKYAMGLSDVAFPSDIYTAPGNTFYTLLVSPHLTLSLGLTLWALGLAFQALRQQSWPYALAAGGVSLVLGLGHIYDLVTVWAVLAAFVTLINLRDGLRQHGKTIALFSSIILVSVPAAGYFGYISSNANPVWKQALAQYDNLDAFTPDPAHLLILMGLPLIVSILTYRGMLPLTDQNERYLFIATWFLANLLIIYLPLRFRIMLLAGLQFPLALLTTRGLFEHIIPWLAGRWSGRLGSLARSWVPALMLILVLPANLYIFGWRMLDMHRHNYPFFLYKDDVAALQWLEVHAEREDIVLSSFTIGHYLPGLTGSRPFLSNAVMTINFAEKQELVSRFFANEATDAERCTFLTRYNIQYLIYGEAERALGDFDPTGSSLFNPIFMTERTGIYQVKVAGCTRYQSP